MEQTDLQSKWQRWVESNSDISPAYRPAALRAVSQAIASNKKRNEIIAAAYLAASESYKPTSTTDSKVESKSRAKAVEANGGIYDIIEADQSPNGQAAFAAVQAVTINKSLSTRAFFATKGFRGRYGFVSQHATSITAMLFISALFMLVLSKTFHHLTPVANRLLLLFVLLIVTRVMFVLLMTPILAERAKVRIGEGRLLVTYGLLTTHQIVCELNWIKEVNWSQTFLQKMFQEGTIRFELDVVNQGRSSIAIPGLVPAKELQGFVDKLRNAAQKMRQGNYITAVRF